MNDLARVWVYQCSREFTSNEIKEVEVAAQTFVAAWQAHGASLTAAFQLIENRFIVLMVDDSQELASGCSIDSSVGFVRDIEKKYNVNLTDKGQVAFWFNNKIEVIPFNKIKPTIAAGQITSDTIIFNNSVARLKEFNENWQIAAKNSWMKRYF
jgi:hypothetical protein